MIDLRCLARLGGWLLAAGVVVVTLCPLGNRPVLTRDPQIERALAYGAVGFALGLGHPRRQGRIFAVLLALAFGLEFAQELTPDRHGRLEDALAKAGGGLAGAILAFAADGLLRRPHHASAPQTAPPPVETIGRRPGRLGQ